MGHAPHEYELELDEQEPPVFLFHGTPKRFLASILTSGLVPKARQYVHLSEDIVTATQVGKRRDENPVLLQIDAKRTWQDGVKFYHGNELVWLADHVQEQYISVYQN